MEKFFWADQIADRIIAEKKGKKIYICASGITPSGVVHIGNFREVITTDLVVRALKEKGRKVKFIYSWDDYDRLRKIPANLPEEKKKKYENYLGMALSEIPSPFPDKAKSYAEHFEKEFEKSCEKVGIKPEFIRQNQMYKKCKYAQGIKEAIEKRKEIMKILDKYRKEPLSEDWMPVEIYCEKCKKDFTKVLNVMGFEIEYECNCGFKEKFDFRKKGIVKLKWRIDWPMRWKYWNVDFEPGGIDHSVHGGSFMTGKEIVKLFGYQAPLYTMYEFVSIKGGHGKISSSVGNTLTLDEVGEIYEPEVLRYLFVGTRPNKGFEISFDNDVIKIYEDFDELERKYYEKEANPQEKRIYELSVLKVPKKKPEKTSFRHLISFIQIGKTKNLNKESKKRAEKVSKWIEKYASDDFKFKIRDKISDEVSLGKKQKQALKSLKESLSVKNFTEEELFNEFYSICNAIGIESSEFFEGAYSVIIGKPKGPRLAGLILSVGKEKIIGLLNQIK
ncbi:MAG: lysine--tRNA ligase [Nanoarchaeota archaeon]